MERSQHDWSLTLPPKLNEGLITPSLCLTTPGSRTEHLLLSTDGRYYLVEWDTETKRFRWQEVDEQFAKAKVEQLRVYRGLTSWKEVFDSHPSGKWPYKLVPPNRFQWKKNPFIEVPPLQWTLLEYCLANRNAKVQDVADHVWGEKSASDKSESTIDSLKSKLNGRLAEAEIPITLSRKQGFVILSIDG